MRKMRKSRPIIKPSSCLKLGLWTHFKSTTKSTWDAALILFGQTNCGGHVEVKIIGKIGYQRKAWKESLCINGLHAIVRFSNEVMWTKPFYSYKLETATYQLSRLLSKWSIWRLRLLPRLLRPSPLLRLMRLMKRTKFSTMKNQKIMEKM